MSSCWRDCSSAFFSSFLKSAAIDFIALQVGAGSGGVPTNVFSYASSTPYCPARPSFVYPKNPRASAERLPSGYDLSVSLPIAMPWILRSDIFDTCSSVSFLATTRLSCCAVSDCFIVDLSMESISDNLFEIFSMSSDKILAGVAISSGNL